MSEPYTKGGPVTGFYAVPIYYCRVGTWKSMGMHQVPVDNFIIYYLVNDVDHIVSIIRIFYGGRDIKGIINHN